MNELDLIREFLSAKFYNLVVYIVILSLLTFILFGIDKYKAITRKWRVPEALLLSLTVIGGAFGGILGMIIFRHKIRKPMFYIIVPFAFVLYVLVIIYVATVPYTGT